MEKFKESKFYLGWKRLLADMKPMTWSQRIDHLWTYYKEYLVVVALLAIFLCAGATVIKAQTQETLVSGMMVNISISQEGYDYLSVDYLEKLGGEEGKQKAELDYTNFSSLEDPTSSEDNYNSMLILLARVSGGMLDYMILDKFAMEYYIVQDVYLDLREFFTPEELEALGDKVITARQEEETEAWAVAVDITDLPFVQDNVRLEEDDRIYFALSGNSQRPEMCRDAWEYIHAWESKKEG
jgi:hypothetical protein